MDKAKVFAELLSKNIDAVEVEFSGGHDEGGVDNITLINRDGSTENFSPYGTWNSLTNSYDDPKEPTLSDDVGNAIVAPIYERYHSFAGEFSVYGTLRWDAIKHTVAFNGQESVEHYESFDEEL
jgi:hypothetical protein